MNLEDFLELVGAVTKIKIIDIGDCDKDLLPSPPQHVIESGDISKDKWSVDKYYEMVSKIKKENKDLHNKLFEPFGPNSFGDLETNKKYFQMKKEIVLHEGFIKDIPYSYSLYRMWIPSDSIFVEEDTLVVYVMKYLRIRDIQNSLKDDECYLLHFKDGLGYENGSIYVCRDNIYVYDDNNNLYLSRLDYGFNKGLNVDNMYEFSVEDYDDDLVDYIFKEMFEECKYKLDGGIA